MIRALRPSGNGHVAVQLIEASKIKRTMKPSMYGGAAFAITHDTYYIDSQGYKASVFVQLHRERFALSSDNIITDIYMIVEDVVGESMAHDIMGRVGNISMSGYYQYPGIVIIIGYAQDYWRLDAEEACGLAEAANFDTISCMILETQIGYAGSQNYGTVPLVSDKHWLKFIKELSNGASGSVSRVKAGPHVLVAKEAHAEDTCAAGSYECRDSISFEMVATYAVNRLTHYAPIVPIAYGMYVSDGKPIMLSEMIVPGTTFTEYIQTHSDEQCITAIGKILDIFVTLSKFSISHNDAHTNNILRRGKDDWTLIDFGRPHVPYRLLKDAAEELDFLDPRTWDPKKKTRIGYGINMIEYDPVYDIGKFMVTLENFGMDGRLGRIVSELCRRLGYRHGMKQLDWLTLHPSHRGTQPEARDPTIFKDLFERTVRSIR